ncbi:cysteine-tRNA ligase [Cryptococcus depauperatus CBS 7841]|uniref:Deoxycytidylate deaminase n=1 Tax=Cryptococcus depauperatus CBS 7841 TaxID=1295531 RepID=A0AAJ8M2D1_9TREE
MATNKIPQPEWFPPTKIIEEPSLKVYNSLTRNKDVFIPTKGKRVDWYNCGPTVYDSSHMGHARNYLTQDIVRRILRDYFGYDVNFVMNITDIDDKIIIRARESHLLEQLISSTSSITTQLLSDVEAGFTQYLTKPLKSISALDIPPNATSFEVFDLILARYQSDTKWANEAREKEEKFGMYLASLAKAKEAYNNAKGKLDRPGNDNKAVKDLVEGATDILGPYLGDKLAETISDPIAVSQKLASFWEESFFEDMARLHILPPDTITRVSEYVPEIVSFVQRIIDHGFAYEGGGSIWFDVEKFEGAEGDEFRYEYAKLQPGSKGNKKLLDEGEGALTGVQGKRRPADFALWKAKSKPGEPAWTSPWGEGRPGWHIECSVMASEVLGSGMDIHSGGVDLMFPHHDNELAQAEAYHGCKQWVNYFLHTGHLHIEGLKMSKSLKNFITIDEALRDYSARQLRLAFMLQAWNAKLDFKKDLIVDTKTKEETFDNFFANVKARINDAAARDANQDGKHHFDEPEKKLMKTFHCAQDNFRAALCDSFNTPTAIQVLLDLVSNVNTYFASRGPRDYNIGPVVTIAQWITRMLRMFGLGEGDASTNQIGWGKEGNGATGGDWEKKLNPYLNAMSIFRDNIRKLAIAGSTPKDILQLCDKFRDYDLANLGVQLDDGQSASGGAIYKLIDPAVLVQAREEKERLAAEKAERKKAAEAKQIAQLEKGRVPPQQMFKPPHVSTRMYSEWDEQGLPVKDEEGKELSKSAQKKAVKEWKAQEKAHEAWLAWQKEMRTPSSGKGTVLGYLERKYGFKRVGLSKVRNGKEPISEQRAGSESCSTQKTFSNPSDLLDYATHNWLSHFVTTDLRTHAEIEVFIKRPFFLLVSVDGPLRVRFEREKARAPALGGQTITLEEFVDQHDSLLHASSFSSSTFPTALLQKQLSSDFRRVLALAHVHVDNSFTEISALNWYLDRLDLLDEERLRPGWDTYFMTLASLASHRSNCMKRRVGALLVRSKRILSTGYNGTPRGTKNCNQGGCSRCNGTARGGEALNECLCLHAEENALLEAGKERIGDDSVIYCNTCPCLRCSVKIVQCGVREVVYNQSYSMDEASAMVFKEGGVLLRQLHMPGAL